MEWRRLTARDGLWLGQFLARSLWHSTFGTRGFRKLGASPSAEAPPRMPPRRIWLFWDKGWDEAPELVRLCLKSWETRNPGWEVVKLDGRSPETRRAIAGTFAERTPTVQAVSNALRLSLLADHGGVWADATTYCLKPLDHWLPPLMPTGFFALDRPGRELLASSWFLAAEPGNYLICAWQARYRRFWRLMRIHHRYWVLSFLFTDLVRRDARAGAIWARTPLVPEVPAEGVAASWHESGLAQVFADAKSSGQPLLKLNWRLPLHEAAGRMLRADLESTASS
jgi:hypothetical protein